MQSSVSWWVIFSVLAGTISTPSAQRKLTFIRMNTDVYIIVVIVVVVVAVVVLYIGGSKDLKG